MATYYEINSSSMEVVKADEQHFHEYSFLVVRRGLSLVSSSDLVSLTRESKTGNDNPLPVPTPEEIEDNEGNAMYYILREVDFPQTFKADIAWMSANNLAFPPAMSAIDAIGLDDLVKSVGNLPPGAPDTVVEGKIEDAFTDAGYTIIVVEEPQVRGRSNPKGVSA